MSHDPSQRGGLAAIDNQPGATAILSSGLDFSALAALFWLSIRQQCRAKRLIVVAFLFALPSIIAIIIRTVGTNDRPVDKEFALLFNIVPLLAALTALLYASGMIQDEFEDQTLTYIVVRPIPKWAIYLAKLASTFLVTFALTAVFSFFAYLAVFWGAKDVPDNITLARPFQIIALLGFSLVGYCSLFGFISICTRRSLIAGLLYIVIFELILANFPIAARAITIMYSFRVLASRWLDANAQNWSIEIGKAATSGECILGLAIASVALIGLAGAIFTASEVRVKTPEGS
jgi:ABC-2 type transport system permease protein